MNSSPFIHGGYSFAFQPIVNMAEKRIVSYEALVRGAANESASQIFQRVTGEDLYRFDEDCRITAIELASRLGLPCNLNLNFLPVSLETSSTAISSTLDAATRHGIATDRIVLEITESEIIRNIPDFINAINANRASGFRIAIDDFGAGYAGLNLLSEFQPDILKIDKMLCRAIETNGPRQAIVRGIIRTCLDLGIDIVAEGIETLDEFLWFRDEGIERFQGYFFSKPGFESLPPANFPD